MAKEKRCRKQYHKDRNANLSDEDREKRRLRSKEIYARNSLFIWDFLSKNPCIDCDETDPVVLEFDHVADKKYNVSCLKAGRTSLATIKREIDKCVVRCANCHRRKTAKQFGYHAHLP